MNCIITDDEPLARQGIQNFVKEISYLNLVAACSNPLQVNDVLKVEQVDLIFMDIQMPKMSGIDFLKNARNLPLTIITTAFPDYALMSYELNVVDYLVKPIPFERFVKAVEKAKELFDLSGKHPGNVIEQNDDYFFVKCESKYEKILFDDVIFIESKQNYVAINTTKKKFISYITLKNVEEHLPPSRFIKVNKSCILSLNKIDSVTGNTITSGIYTFTIGRTNKDEILKKILGDHVIRRK